MIHTFFFVGRFYRVLSLSFVSVFEEYSFCLLGSILFLAFLKHFLSLRYIGFVVLRLPKRLLSQALEKDGAQKAKKKSLGQ